MPDVDVIIRARPADPNSLRQVNYPLGFIEKFAQTLNIQMQFELTADCILVFFKTLADFEKILQVLSDSAVETNPNYVPSEDFTMWEFSVVKSANGENQTLLQKFSKGFHIFLGTFGRVEMQDEKVVIHKPRNLRIDKSDSSKLPQNSTNK